MAKPKLSYVGDAKLRSLLEAYACPVPLHAVKARFMGNIASPALGASPLRSIENLWPDGLPMFENTEEADRLIQVLLSLWNHLARHQRPTNPFQFSKQWQPDTRKQLADFVVMLCEEIENFLEGLFNGEETFDVSEGIAFELDIFEEVQRLLSNVRALLTTEAGTQPEPGPVDLPRQVRDLSLMAEAQVNKIIQACVAARRASLSAPYLKRRTLH